MCTRAASLYCGFGYGACIVKNSGPGFTLKWVSNGDTKREIVLNQRFDRMVVVTTVMRD